MDHEHPANVLVCVTDQPSCRRLIVAGASIAQRLELPLKVVCVRPEGAGFPENGGSPAGAVQHLRQARRGHDRLF